MSDFDSDLAAAKEKRVTAPNTETVEVLLNGHLVTLKFTEMDPMDWAEITSRNPVRLGAPIDRQYGYNVHGACRAAAAKCGVRVENGTDVPLALKRDSAGKVIGSQWNDLLSTISGHEFGKVADVIFGLNEWDPQRRLDDAKKALALAPEES